MPHISSYLRRSVTGRSGNGVRQAAGGCTVWNGRQRRVQSCTGPLDRGGEFSSIFGDRSCYPIHQIGCGHHRTQPWRLSSIPQQCTATLSHPGTPRGDRRTLCFDRTYRELPIASSDPRIREENQDRPRRRFKRSPRLCCPAPHPGSSCTYPGLQGPVAQGVLDILNGVPGGPLESLDSFFSVDFWVRLPLFFC